MTDDLRIGSLCTGYGGLDMAVQAVLGGTLAWVSDIDPGASRILAHHHPEVPNLGDLTAVDWTGVEPVDVLCGGYPCQPFSLAGKRKGTADERHIWPSIAHALRVLRPRYAIFENVANHLRLGFADVLADLARLGFDAEWCAVRASEVGAAHDRRRLFLLARPSDAQGPRQSGEGLRGRLAERGGVAADPDRVGGDRRGSRGPGRAEPAPHGDASTDPARLGRREGRSEPARLEGRPGPAVRSGAAAADTDRDGREEQQRREPGMGPWGDSDGRGPERWGRFAPAVTRWETVLGRPAPGATDARRRLNPAFVEWLMGLPAGHVTDVPGLTRTQQLKALGNGVVPQQAEAALRMLLDRTTPEEAHP
ncbi:DNA cytosine methyltransferase [Streptomyces sp. NPDC126499]|uniref:DNA cytosine methyltransferase n=1 Tax=Streptomyces sp. NPDC126499 TaxID=3155314 RepID=UPI00331C3FBB